MPDNPQDATFEETTPSQGQPLESPKEVKPMPPKADTPPAPPLPGEDLAEAKKPPVPPGTPAEKEILPPPAPIIATPKPPSKIKIIVGITILIFFLASISAGVFLVRQRQETRKKAAGEDQLICMPIDENGNLTNEKYGFNRIKVINNTSASVILWIQENICDYQGQEPAPPYVCNQYARRYNDTITSGENKTYSIDVPCQKIGQLDVAQDDAQMGAPTPDCYNLIDGKIWEGGIAFTLQANSEICPTPTPTPGPTGTPTPTLTPAPTSTPTPIPTPTAKPTPAPESTNCEKCRVYDKNWNLITDFSKIVVGQKIYLTTYGLTTYPAGETPLPGRITKARFRINQGIWQETEEIKGTWKCVGQTCTSPEFYITYTIPSAGSYKIESMVYNQTFGWQ